MKKRWRRLGWVGIALVSLVFLQAGVLKLIGEPMTVAGFEQLGYPVWLRLLVGILEVTGGILLFFRRVARYAAAGLAMIMIGAMVSVLQTGGGVELILPAVTFCLLVAIAVIRKPDRGAVKGKADISPV